MRTFAGPNKPGRLSRKSNRLRYLRLSSLGRCLPLLVTTNSRVPQPEGLESAGRVRALNVFVGVELGSSMLPGHRALLTARRPLRDRSPATAHCSPRTAHCSLTPALCLPFDDPDKRESPSLLDAGRNAEPSSRLKFAERNSSLLETVLAFHCFGVANSATQCEWTILVGCEQKRSDGNASHGLGIRLGRNCQPSKAEFSNDGTDSFDLESDGAVIFCRAINRQKLVDSFGNASLV